MAEPPVAWSERQKKRCGAVVSIGYDGDLDVTRGLIAPADTKTAKGEDGSAESEDGDTPAAQADTDAAELSNALCADLTAQRTAALRAVLAGNVPVALATLAHAPVSPVFYPGYAENPLDVRGSSPCLSGEGIDDNRGSKDMAARHAAWLQRLPEDEGVLWDWLIALDPAALADLIAYCAAATVKPEGGPHIDRVAAAVVLDLGVEGADRRSRPRRGR